MPATPEWNNLIFGITADKGTPGSSEFRVYPSGTQTRTINNPGVDNSAKRNASASMGFNLTGTFPGGVIGLSSFTDIGTGPITLSVFARPLSGSNGIYARILTWGTPGQVGSVSILLNNAGNPSEALAQVVTGSGVVTVGNFGVIPNGVFTHLEVSRDASNTWRLFKDGILIATVTNVPSFSSSQSVCLVGSEMTTGMPSQGFKGHIEDPQIYKACLHTTNFVVPAWKLGPYQGSFTGTLTEDSPVSKFQVSVIDSLTMVVSETAQLDTSSGVFPKSFTVKHVSENPVLVAVAEYVSKGAWAPTTMYAQGDDVYPTDAVAHPYIFRRTSSGVSGASEPTWNVAPGGFTVDNAISQAWVILAAISKPQIEGPFPPDFPN
jgi:hypothetical protein